MTTHGTADNTDSRYSCNDNQNHAKNFYGQISPKSSLISVAGYLPLQLRGDLAPHLSAINGLMTVTACLCKTYILLDNTVI